MPVLFLIHNKRNDLCSSEMYFYCPIKRSIVKGAIKYRQKWLSYFRHISAVSFIPKFASFALKLLLWNELLKWIAYVTLFPWRFSSPFNFSFVIAKTIILFKKLFMSISVKNNHLASSYYFFQENFIQRFSCNSIFIVRLFPFFFFFFFFLVSVHKLC